MSADSKFEKLFEQTNWLTGEIDANRILWDVNDNWSKILGWSRDELNGSPILDFFHPDDIERTIEEARRMIRENVGTAGFMNRVLCRDGSHRWLEWYAIIDSAPRVYFIALDETENVINQRRLEESEDLLRRTSKMGRIGSWYRDIGDDSSLWSDEVCRIHEVPAGYQPDLNTAIEFYAPEARPVFRAAIEAGMADGTPWDLELPLITAKGRHIWVRAVGQAQFDNGVPTRLYGTFQDITSRRALQLDVERYTRALREMHAISIDQKSGLQEKFERLLKLGVEGMGMETALISEIDGERLTILCVYDTVDCPWLSVAEFVTSSTYSSRVIACGDVIAEADVKSSDLAQVQMLEGGEFGSYIGSPIMVEGAVFGTISIGSRTTRDPFSQNEIDLLRLFADWIGQELTKQKAEKVRHELEVQLRHSQKIETVGSLAGGIAHDLNNILTPLLGFTELALGEQGISEQSEAWLGQIGTAARRARDLVQQILLFSRLADPNPVTMQFGPLIDEALRLIQPTMPPEVELITELDCDSAWVRADPGQMHQIIVNLCTNAWQAMAGAGGTLHLQLDCTDIDSTPSRALCVVAAGRFVRIVVKDSGVGMDEQTIERIFEPFFTTKAVGVGTGLGLSTVLGVVENHDGTIFIESQPGTGTTVTVLIPWADPQLSLDELAGEGGDIVDPVGVGLNIVVVDDESSIVDLVTAFLNYNGFSAVGFTNAQDALAHLKENSSACSLLLTDVSMPSMTGPELAQAARESSPDLPILFISGHDFSKAHASELSALGSSRILPKPFELKELRSIIVELIDAKK